MTFKKNSSVYNYSFNNKQHIILLLLVLTYLISILTKNGISLYIEKKYVLTSWLGFFKYLLFSTKFSDIGMRKQKPLVSHYLQCRVNKQQTRNNSKYFGYFTGIKIYAGLNFFQISNN